MDYQLVQYGCNKCGKLTEVLDLDESLPEGWTYGEGLHVHYCPECSKASKVEEAMRDVEQKAKAFTKAHAGETSDQILAQMRGEG